MSNSIIMNGKFALVEHLPMEQAIILIFETPFNITGQGLAVIGCFGINSVNEMIVGDSIKAAFDARTVLSFEEDIKAREKSAVSLTSGNYTGEGILEDSQKCNFKFISDIIPGEWNIKYITKNRDGLLRHFHKGEMLILRIA